MDALKPARLPWSEAGACLTAYPAPETFVRALACVRSLIQLDG